MNRFFLTLPLFDARRWWWMIQYLRLCKSSGLVSVWLYSFMLFLEKNKKKKILIDQLIWQEEKMQRSGEEKWFQGRQEVHTHELWLLSSHCPLCPQRGTQSIHLFLWYFNKQIIKINQCKPQTSTRIFRGPSFI